jgi:hypothetical protein
VLQLLVAANVVPGSLIIFTVMTEATNSSETSVLTRVTRNHIPEDCILQVITKCVNKTGLVEVRLQEKYRSHIAMNIREEECDNIQ